MKRIVLAIFWLCNLSWQDVDATVIVEDDHNEVMLAAEITFAAASLYMGISNARQGYAGYRSLPASLFGLAVGMTSLAFSTSNDAELAALDIGAGLLAVGGSLLRFPRADAVSVNQEANAIESAETGADLDLVAGFRRIGMRLTF